VKLKIIAQPSCFGKERSVLIAVSIVNASFTAMVIECKPLFFI